MKIDPSKLHIRNAELSDLSRIVEIYNASILGGTAVADVEPIKVEDRRVWFHDHSPHKHPLWVLQRGTSILGWASVQPYYSDPAFVSTAEVSVHIAPDDRNQGFGTFLLSSIIKTCPKLGITTLLGFSFADNAITARLNKRVGLAQWGYLPKTAWIKNRRIDLIIYGINIPDAEDSPCMDQHPTRSLQGMNKQLLPDPVADHYDTNCDSEALRLESQSPIEFAITLRNIDRWLPHSAVVADIGVGVGHYAETLASRGCSLHLCDISEKLLGAAVARLEAAGLRNRIHQACQVSAVNLHCIDSESCDAALLLGPLYHLINSDARHHAILEVSRILKPGGILFAAGINRLAYFKDLLRSTPCSVIERESFHRRFLNDGILDAQHAPQIGTAYLTTVKEFRAEFANYFKELAFLGVESFAAEFSESFNLLAQKDRELWLELIETTACSLEGSASANHFLFIGKRI